METARERPPTEKLVLAAFLALTFAWSAFTAGRGTARTCLSGACFPSPNPGEPGTAPTEGRVGPESAFVKRR